MQRDTTIFLVRVSLDFLIFSDCPQRPLKRSFRGTLTFMVSGRESPGIPQSPSSTQHLVCCEAPNYSLLSSRRTLRVLPPQTLPIPPVLASLLSPRPSHQHPLSHPLRCLVPPPPHLVSPSHLVLLLCLVLLRSHAPWGVKKKENSVQKHHSN
jgi:hypothetical protein